MDKTITWDWEGQFCSANYVQCSRKPYCCEGCGENIPVGSALYRAWRAGDGSYSVCMACWDHKQKCVVCHGATWSKVAECRKEADRG